MRWLGFLAGSVATYLAVAACSATAGHSGATLAIGGLGADGAAGVPTATRGAPGAAGGLETGGLLDAGLDAIVDPVPDARAEAGAGGQAGADQATGGGTGCAVCSCDCPVYVPPEPEIVEAPCVSPPGNGLPVAELLRPGMTQVQLSAVRWILHRGNPYGGLPAGYVDSAGTGGYVKEGATAIQCGFSSDSVTFIVPGES